jgi:hypothetical protein
LVSRLLIREVIFTYCVYDFQQPKNHALKALDRTRLQNFQNRKHPMSTDYETLGII